MNDKWNQMYTQTVWTGGGVLVGGAIFGRIGGMIGGIVGSCVGYYLSNKYCGIIFELFTGLRSEDIPELLKKLLPLTLVSRMETHVAIAAGGAAIGGLVIGSKGALIGGIIGSVVGYFDLTKLKAKLSDCFSEFKEKYEETMNSLYLIFSSTLVSS